MPVRTLVCRACFDVVPPSSVKLPLVCPGCQQLLYCCSFCLKQDGPAHAASGECHLLQATTARLSLQAFMRETCLALRLLHKPLKLSLASHTGNLLAAAGADAALIAAAARCMAEATARAAAQHSTACSLQQAQQAICQVLTNAVEIVSEPGDMGPLSKCCGIAIYDSAARLNHDCRPNAAYLFRRGASIVVRSLRSITAGQELTIAYLDCTLPVHRRREQLQERYSFRCCCARCVAESAHVPDEPASKRLRLQNGSVASAEGASSLAEATDALGRTLAEASNLLVEADDPAGAAAQLHPALVVLLAASQAAEDCLPSHLVLEAAAMLASAWRMCSMRSLPAAAGRLYTSAMAVSAALVAAAACSRFLVAGETGVLSRTAHHYHDLATLLCQHLAAHLASAVSNSCHPASAMHPSAALSTVPASGAGAASPHLPAADMRLPDVPVVISSAWCEVRHDLASRQSPAAGNKEATVQLTEADVEILAKALSTASTSSINKQSKDSGMQHLQVQLAAQAVQAGAQPAEVQLLQHLPLAAAAAAMQAHAARLLRIVLGSSHAACDRAVYASCSAGLPFQLGAAMARLAQLLAADQAAGSR